jgi:hypothetical protein
LPLWSSDSLLEPPVKGGRQSAQKFLDCPDENRIIWTLLILIPASGLRFLAPLGLLLLPQFLLLSTTFFPDYLSNSRILASALSILDFRVEGLEFSACVIDFELPIDPALLLVTGRRPRGGFRRQLLGVAKPAVV